MKAADRIYSRRMSYLPLKPQKFYFAILWVYYGFILQNCNEDADAIGIDTMTIRYFHKKVSKINPFRYSHGD